MHLFEVHVFCGFCAGRVRAAAPGPRRDGPRVRETDPARPTGTVAGRADPRETGVRSGRSGEGKGEPEAEPRRTTESERNIHVIHPGVRFIF